MNIYFVNRYSRYKGPFDIIGPHREHIINVGDICLHDSIEGIEFLVVCSSDNFWKSCKRVGIGNNEDFSDLGNTLLFSFDGLHKRKGNASLIRKLSDCFKEKVIYDFFCNAVGILEYNVDFWDVTLFRQFFATTQDFINRPNKTLHSVVSDSESYPSHFAKYLDKELLGILISCINEGKDLKQAYVFLREHKPILFRDALIKFNKENPPKTIYDKYPIHGNLTVKKEPTSLNISNNTNFHTETSNEPFVLQELHKRKKDDIDSSYHSIFKSEYNNDEIISLFKRYHNGDAKAYDLLVKGHLNLVYQTARLFVNKGLSLEDLFQEGSIGLLKAIDTFYYTSGERFTSYAQLVIYYSIKRAIPRLGCHVKIPERHVLYHNKIRKIIESHEQANGFPPSFYEIKLDEKVSSELLRPIFNLPDDLLDMTILKDDMDFIVDDSFLSDKKMDIDSERYDVLRLVHSLSKRESKFLEAYYGLNGVLSESLEQIAMTYGLTRERVRQIVEKSRRKLQENVGLRKKKNNDNKRKGEREHKITNKKKIVKKDNNSRQNTISNNIKINHYKKEDCILRVLQKTPWFIRRSAMDISKQIEREEGVYIDPESVKLSLQKMPHIDCVKGKYKLVENTVPKQNQKDSAILYKKSSQVKLPNELAQTSPTEKSLIFPNNPPSPSNYSSSTSLQELRNCGLLTRKECIHCHYKGLFTIGDVQLKIQKYNLTPDSSRFTKHTINLWFKIVGFLESSPIKDSEKDITDIIQPNPQDNNLEDSYVKYFLKIDSIRQSKNNGHTSIAKPVLLLAIIDGITEGEIKNNQVTLNEWLEGKYNSLMTSFSRQSKITPINMPFWHLESDGFWHLNILKGKTRYVTPTIRWLKENVLYASLDDELWFLLQKDEWRNKLRNFIISNKL